MKKNAWLARLLTLSLSLSPLYAQQQQGSAPRTSPASPSHAAEEDVLRITTNLVQLDAVVTDKDGRVVSDLRAEDFEVLEDGRPQASTNLSFVPLEPLAAAETSDAARASTTKDRNALPVPSRRLRPEQARRTMALVAGYLSFGSMDAVHDALKKYVDEQVQPDDLVAIIPLAGSNGALQQFTTDRRQLARAVERVRWKPAYGYDVDPMETERRHDTNTGALTLRPDAAPGSYVLQVIVNDAPPGKKRQTATQWIDFEVVRQ